jgi:hypothetical protein
MRWKDEVRFVLDQHAKLDFYSASSLKQQSADRHVTSNSRSTTLEVSTLTITPQTLLEKNKKQKNIFLL